MLEIIGIILLCRTNKKNAVAAGKRGGGAIGMTIGMWIGLEIVGLFIGGISGLDFYPSYIIAIIFAAIGGITSYAIAKTPSKKQGTHNVPGGQYAPAPANMSMPHPQGYADASRQTGYYLQNRFCVRCGAPLAAGAMFCGACGYAVNHDAPPAPIVSPPETYKQRDVFYVFAVQGPAFGAAGGSDIVMEKAQKLKDDYEPAKDMEMKIIRPGIWKSNIQSSSTGGIVSVSYNFDNFKDGIREYLLKEGIQGGTVENGIKLCDDNSLQLSNPMSGVFVMGIPIISEIKPDAEAQIPHSPESAPPPAPTPCAHEYKYFTCIKCGEKAPKPQLESKGIRKQNQHTYEDYVAQSAGEAKCFLEQTSVTAPLYYVLVHTPEGDWGKDKDGVFLSQLCGFQRDLSLRQCDAKTALFPERMPDLQMAANKVADNYTLTVTCGICGHSWIDGVGYRTKTIVRCPDCGKYNLADTEHIRFNDL